MKWTIKEADSTFADRFVEADQYFQAFNGCRISQSRGSHIEISPSVKATNITHENKKKLLLPF